MRTGSGIVSITRPHTLLRLPRRARWLKPASLLKWTKAAVPADAQGLVPGRNTAKPRPIDSSLRHHGFMIEPEQLVGDEWAEWYRLTPVQRWLESERLWQIWIALGGSLDPEPDTQSPFFDPHSPGPPPDGRPAGVRVLRCGRV